LEDCAAGFTLIFNLRQFGDRKLVGVNLRDDGVTFAPKQENVMIRFGLIGATALSLMLSLAIPAVAGDVQNTSTHRYNRHVRTVPPGAIIIGEPSLPIENALRWGYSQGYQYYPSGFGGLYGDGRYPGNTIENRNYPTWW
jgi:hypothetical protein